MTFSAQIILTERRFSSRSSTTSDDSFSWNERQQEQKVCGNEVDWQMQLFLMSFSLVLTRSVLEAVSIYPRSSLITVQEAANSFKGDGRFNPKRSKRCGGFPTMPSQVHCEFPFQYGETVDQSTKGQSYSPNQLHLGGEFRRFAMAEGFDATPASSSSSSVAAKNSPPKSTQRSYRTVNRLLTSPMKTPSLTDILHPNDISASGEDVFHGCRECPIDCYERDDRFTVPHHSNG